MDRRFADDRDVQELWDSVRSEVLRRGADVHTADDVAQEAWLRAVRRPPEDLGRFRGWLHVVAVRLLREVRRTEGSRSRRELASARVDRAETIDAAETSTLLRYLEELDEPYRTVIRLRFIEDREVAEIAESLGLHPEAVRSRLKRGLGRLRARIEPAPKRRSRLRGVLAWIERCLRRVGPGSSAARRVAATGIAAVSCLSVWYLWLDDRPAQVLGYGPSVAQAEARAAPPLQPVPSERAPTATAPGVPAAVEATDGPRLRLAGLVLTPAGTPVPHALVHAASAGDLAGEVVAVADVRGRYEIPARRHDLVWASHAGWCDSRLCYVLSLVDPGPPGLPSAEPRPLDLFLSPTRGRASVVILGQSGTPVEHARVQLNPLERPDHVCDPRGTLEFFGPPPSATSDADGRVEFSFPARGWVDLLVVAQGFPACLEQRRTPEPGSEITLTLPEPAVVVGTCVDEDGLPSWNAEVEVLQFGGLVWREARTGRDGSFRVDQLSPGEFVLRVGEDPVYGPRSARHEGFLAPGASADLPLVLDERSSIHGVLLDRGRPVAGMTVSLFPKSNHTAEGSEPRSARTDAHGMFAFAGCRLDTPQKLRALPGGVAVGTERVVPPGQGEVVLELETEVSRLAPIELAFLGDAVDLPRFVELRIEPGFSLVLESLSDPRRFRSPPLRKGRYMLVAWAPESGAWLPGLIHHDPGSPRVHDLPLPQPGWLTVELELPPGISRDEVEVAVQVESFNALGLGALGRLRAQRALVWDPVGELYSCELRPGDHPLVVRAPGMAEIFEPFRVNSGEETRLRLAGLPGIELPVFFRSPRFLVPNERLHMDVLTPQGTKRIDLRWRHQRLVPGGFSFLIWLPESTTELSVFTEVTDGGETLEGRRTVAAGEFREGLEVELAPSPR